MTRTPRTIADVTAENGRKPIGLTVGNGRVLVLDIDPNGSVLKEGVVRRQPDMPSKT